MLLAKREGAKHWSSPNTPSIAAWRTGTDWCVKLEAIIYPAQRNPHKYDKVWSKCWAYHGLKGHS